MNTLPEQDGLKKHAKNSDLKAARKRLNLTAKEMAIKLNTPQKTYEYWEYRGKIPGIVSVTILLIEKYG